MASDVSKRFWEDASSWPSFAQTARLLAIDRSTLTKQARTGQITFIRCGLGRGERRVSPIEVIRLAEQYRRVPVGDVRRALVQGVARRFQTDETELLKGLDDLLAREVKTRPGLREIDLGPLRPRIVDREAVPSPDFLAALEMRISRQPEVVVERRVHREIDLGELRPGQQH